MWLLFPSFLGFLPYLSFLCAICHHKLDIDEGTGAFLVYIGKEELNTNEEATEPWLHSYPPSIKLNGRKYSTDDSSLLIKRVEMEDGDGILGKYRKTTMSMESIDGDAWEVGLWDYYDSCKFIVEQAFPKTLSNVSIHDADDIISSYPSFIESSTRPVKGYAQWVSWYYTASHRTRRSNDESGRTLVAPGFTTPILGVWGSNNSSSDQSPYGGIGGSGVLCLFDETHISVVISALTNTMAVSMNNLNGVMGYGVMGNVTTIPQHFSTKVIVEMSDRGINAAMEKWGESVRSYHGKQSTDQSRTKDETLQYLGYTTDNGAYYYYHTENDRSTYEDTLIAMKGYADKEGIPIRYVLLDSWWYYKGSSGGVTNWTAQPSVFPRGLSFLYEQTGWHIQAHNRYWDIENVYSTRNGGEYDFVSDPIHMGAVPASEGFWRDLFSGSHKWGLQVYEQDWLFNEFYEYVSPLLEDVFLARQWLLQMGAGAAAHNLTIQYCMPFVRQLLQSLEVPVVTQARASDDYVVSPYDGVDNWRIGGQTILLDALGLAASKDGFWTTKYQPGNPYGEDRYEPHSALHSAVATLSGGPVAIGDGVGYTDVSLVMRSCRMDGRLLQPSYAARAIDAMILQATFAEADGPAGEVWFARSEIRDHESSTGSPYRYGYLLVADLARDWVLTLPMIDISPGEYIVVDVNNATPRDDLQVEIHVLSVSQGLPLRSCGLDDFQLFSLSPVLPNGWALLGELRKWVTVSDARFREVRMSLEGGMVARVVGAPGENIEVSFYSPSKETTRVLCTVGSAGEIWIGVSSVGGRCSESTPS